MAKSLFELKSERKTGGAKDKNTLTDADYFLRDKTKAKDKKNTVWMTPNPAEIQRRLVLARKAEAEAKELAELEAKAKERESVDLEAKKKAETEAKRQATIAKKKADEEANKAK